MISRSILSFEAPFSFIQFSLRLLRVDQFTPRYFQTKSSQQTTAANVENEKIESAQKSLHIAVIGVPNAGKSTFINNLINHRVCPTSSKVHTTRSANVAICTTGNTQIVFLDTPGLVTKNEIKRYNLENSFKTAYRKAIQDADAIAVLHDASNARTRNELHHTVLDTLKSFPKLPSFLVLNKIDCLKSKRILLDLIRKLTNDKLREHNYDKKTVKDNEDAKKQMEDTNKDEKESSLIKRPTSWNNFEDIFLVSSLTGDGMDRINEYLILNAINRAWKYPGTEFTGESPENLIVQSVRARLLDYLPQEIPYNLKSEIEYYSDKKSAIYASVLVTTPTARIERLICGQSNGKLRQITERVTSDLVETFGKPIALTISTTSQIKAEVEK